MNPSPSTLLWRPDRLTARYHIEPGVREPSSWLHVAPRLRHRCRGRERLTAALGGRGGGGVAVLGARQVVLEEVKFFTNDDVLLDIITLLPAAAGEGTAPPATVQLNFGGVSYVNTHNIPSADIDPSSKGLPPTTQRSIKVSRSSFREQLVRSLCLRDGLRVPIAQRHRGARRSLRCRRVRRRWSWRRWRRRRWLQRHSRQGAWNWCGGSQSPPFPLPTTHTPVRMAC
jgi:hypothetical protein